MIVFNMDHFTKSGNKVMGAEAPSIFYSVFIIESDVSCS